MNWRYDFIKTYLERDIPQLGPIIPAQTLEQFWTMLAHNQGTSINASKLAANIVFQVSMLLVTLTFLQIFFLFEDCNLKLNPKPLFM